MFTDPEIERGIIGVAADWLDATLYDNCGLCRGTEWAMQSENRPPQ